MNDKKLQFRNWLKQQSFKDTTIDTYIRMLNKVSNDDWEQLQENVLLYLVKYYELANKEYFLDRVTIWQALDYFSQIINTFNQQKSIFSSMKVKIYLFDGKDNYFICNTYIGTLYADLLLLNNYLYYPEKLLKHQKGSSIDVMKLSILMMELSEKPQMPELRDFAIHIVYDKNSRNIKTALTKYWNFLSMRIETNTDRVHDMLLYVQKLNPNKTLNNNFEEKRAITGRLPRQVTPKPNTRRDTELGFVYSLPDLAAIFNIDFNTALELMNRFGLEYKISTCLHDYYSSEATNKCLAAYHHFKDKDIKKSCAGSIYPNVDYDKQGYEQWGTREDVMKRLGIKKAAFYAHIHEKCLYTDYAENARKYYLPELKYFETLDKIKHIRMRKK